MKFPAIIGLINGLLFATHLSANEVRVVDGDTLEVDGQMIRINGIDAPEADQKCDGRKKPWPCGKRATEKMAELVVGKDVLCEEHSRDRYGRIIGTCHANGIDVGQALVQAGLSWAYLQYSDVYEVDQAEAQNQKLGIWQVPTLPAWEFRKIRWDDAVKDAPAEAPEGCPIKGNISANGHIYHAPWSPWYSRTKIDTSKGERWFCDELEATKAGWRAPYWW